MLELRVSLSSSNPVPGLITLAPELLRLGAGIHVVAAQPYRGQGSEEMQHKFTAGSAGVTRTCRINTTHRVIPRLIDSPTAGSYGVVDVKFEST